MAQAYARIKAAIQAAVDLGTNLLDKISLGTPGSKVLYPTGPTNPLQITWDTGGVWSNTSGNIIDWVLSYIGKEHDRALPIWAEVHTDGAAVAPSITADTGFASVAKNEVTDTITLTLSTAYANSNYFIWAYIYNAGSLTIVNLQAVGEFTLSFVDHAGVTLDINNRDIQIFCSGQA